MQATLSASLRPSTTAPFQSRSHNSRRARPVGRKQHVVTALSDTNLLINLIGSATCGTIPAAVTVATSEDRDAAIERIQTVEGATPLLAAVAADAITHSIPGLNVLFNLLSEPVGAAAGVAYLMSIVLSSPSVDPKTMAPKGTVLNAEKAKDIRRTVRQPFVKIIPTALNVVDFSNSGSSGAGWTQDANGYPKLPITSVVGVLVVGGLFLELVAHAPVLGIFFPRVLSVAGWLAVAGYLLDKYQQSEAT